jgi:DNA mismatch repair protein MSH2
LPEGSEHAAKQTKFSNEEIAEGTALVSEMLKAWAEKKADDIDLELTLPSNTQDSAMDGADGETADAAGQTERIKKEMTLLKQCFEEFRPRLEKSPWAMTALLETY